MKTGKPQWNCGKMLGSVLAAIWLAAAPSGAQGAAEVKFVVVLQGESHPISPLIYGINSFEPTGLLADSSSFRRLGGNRTSGYNWENNASNAGRDWHYQNDNHLSNSDEPAAAYLEPMRTTLAKGGYVLATVPMTDYVAADKLGDGDIAKTPDFVHKRLVANHPSRGTPFPPTPDLNDRAVYQDEFVGYLKAKLPGAFIGTPARIMFALDNEADLWFETHPRLMGSAEEKAPLMTARDYFKRSAAYAEAIKAVAPNALVFGPASYGWAGMRNFQGAEHDAKDFLDSYLAFMQDEEKSTGHRLLDVLDIHWYPSDQVDGKGIGGNEADPAIQEARMNAPRSLWDRKFVEPSWIGKWNGAVQLIPRLQHEIERNYPGTAIAITEYNYGGANDISGGIAEADVLGIFGRYGVFAANHWGMGDDWTYIHAGMTMFRDFDGKNGHFGDVSLEAQTDDSALTSIYASSFSTVAGKMVVVLINKRDEPVTAALRIDGKASFGSAHLYALTEASTKAQDRGVVASAAANAFSIPMPRRSVVTMVIQ